jgi:hypothetical protein
LAAQRCASGSFHWRSSSASFGNQAQLESLRPCFDALKFGKDGHFQTVQLEPGTYTFVAHAYAPVISGTRDTNNPSHLPAFVSVARVMVTTKAVPPVKLELRPRVEPAKRP